MQVQFTADELQVLADVLAQHNRELTHEIARTDDRKFKIMLLKKLDVLTQLENQLVQGDVELSSEESDDLVEMLNQSERALYFEIARTDDRDFKHILQKKLERLECAHHKLVEPRAVA
ncbi:MAG: hypothetical protein CXZ00_10815 [Acidobacteria bacterium]|nr:MAG: hypothetical protein CXZ00_10815 [Acidobacteriota bacterium]